MAPGFDAGVVAANIKWAQANPPEYSYAAFCKNVKAAGCAGYIVSFPAAASSTMDARRNACGAFPKLDRTNRAAPGDAGG